MLALGAKETRYRIEWRSIFTHDGNSWSFAIERDAEAILWAATVGLADGAGGLLNTKLREQNEELHKCNRDE
jgi:hypothetical protein